MTWSDSSPHKEGFVTVNGIRLQYNDWGGTGAALILIHGDGDNPHIFDDLAPAFIDRFHVLAYARRGCGDSQARAPYDTATLTEDLRGLMDALGIAKADLVGWSMGGNEITAMAAAHPERVGRLVYFDAAYDWADSDFVVAFKALPRFLLDPPASAMSSLDAYRSYTKAVRYTALDNMGRIEAYLRNTVIIQSDGSLKTKIQQEAIEATHSALLTDRRDYTRVRAAALAIYPDSFLDLHIATSQWRHDAQAWEQKYMVPFRAKSIDRVRRELAKVEIIRVGGTHNDFFFTSRKHVVAAMRRFLSEPNR